MSAPARLAFMSASGTTPLISPTNMESDLSPIPSPWLRPTNDYMSIPTHGMAPVLSQKRNNAVLEEGRNNRGPIISASRSIPSNSKHTNFRGPVPSSSTSATPARALKRRKNSLSPGTAATLHGENQIAHTPSPIDLSMPPPSSSVQSRRLSPGNVPQGNASTGLEPVTPASIMGLDMKNTRETRGSSQPAVLAKAATQNKPPPPKKNVETRAVSASKTAPANVARQTTSAAASGRQPQSRKQVPQAAPQVPVKKHTHRDAEQKRRDSLKSSFDELRDLLPPIPLTFDDPRFADNPPLPGSLPPRGPPKGDAGPNRHVSKLQLLRCGNDYIRQLKGRVERRDNEIWKLRSAILRLRDGEQLMEGDGEELDLERDLDADEVDFGASRENTGVEFDGEGDEGDE